MKKDTEGYQRLEYSIQKSMIDILIQKSKLQTKLPEPNEIDSCFLCGSKNTSLDWTSHNGHGDSGHSDLRVKCNDCTVSIGDSYGYSEPGLEDKNRTIMLWNAIKR